jgi:hypothetical protein
VAVGWKSMKRNGTDSPSLLFKEIHCRNLLDPDRTQAFDFIFSPRDFPPLGLEIPEDHPDRNRYFLMTFRKK